MDVAKYSASCQNSAYFSAFGAILHVLNCTKLCETLRSFFLKTGPEVSNKTNRSQHLLFQMSKHFKIIVSSEHFT